MSSTEQAKESSDQPVALPFPFNPAFPAGPFPPILVYPAPQQPDADGNATTQTPQFMMIPPPGVFYFPTASGQGFSIPAISSTSATPSTSVSAAAAPPNRPKRKQVKTACTNCADACKRCDEGRPCERCLKLNIGESCKDSQRKERKKGIKRGPYKRKNKTNSDSTPSESSEWAPTQPLTTPTMMPAVAQLTSEGIPVYYPPPFIPATETQPGPDGTYPNGHTPTAIPYFYPPFFPHSFGLVPPAIPTPAADAPSASPVKQSPDPTTKGTSDPSPSEESQKISDTASASRKDSQVGLDSDSSS